MLRKALNKFNEVVWKEETPEERQTAKSKIVCIGIIVAVWVIFAAIVADRLKIPLY